MYFSEQFYEKSTSVALLLLFVYFEKSSIVASTVLLYNFKFSVALLLLFVYFEKSNIVASTVLLYNFKFKINIVVFRNNFTSSSGPRCRSSILVEVAVNPFEGINTPSNATNASNGSI